MICTLVVHSREDEGVGVNREVNSPKMIFLHYNGAVYKTKLSD